MEKASAGVCLAHVTIEVRRPDRWKGFLASVSEGRARVEWLEPGSFGSMSRALRIRPGRADDLVALGLAWSAPAEFEAALARLAARGVVAEPIERPGVLRAAQCEDPAGNRLELLLQDGEDVATESWPVGHVALAHAEPEALTAFYGDVIGFRLNETLRTRLGPIALRGGFLGGARRHHSIAVLNVPSRRRLGHVMFEAPDILTVLRAADRARRAGIPFSLDLGQHPPPDGTTSFYAGSPSGFDIEIGGDSQDFAASEDAAPGESATTSAWGHAPSLRTRLRVAQAMALEKLGF
ncbi:VOC family protein [Paeniroseomonas aquatica]|uniref:VOC family protein n=1 Tax=Paeniroseomonas aquatica TaxID=373043 RepID=A0ABT8ABT3_9PROT|nr:VOC family protein [Paeniroseomonas aquatica]MDN3567294.1 VOC family protein [Paeniroseomonas aquatica]